MEVSVSEARKKEQGRLRRKAAWEQFKAASILAARHGLRLSRHSPYLYKLSGTRNSWVLEVYPGNLRLFRSHGVAPFLDVPDEWVLLDVVNATIRAERKIE